MVQYLTYTPWASITAADLMAYMGVDSLKELVFRGDVAPNLERFLSLSTILRKNILTSFSQFSARAS